MFGFRVHEGPRMGDMGENETKLLVVSGSFYFDLRVDFASPNQLLFVGGGYHGITLASPSFFRFLLLNKI